MGDHYYSWIPAERLKAVLQPEPAVLVLLLSVTAWLGYRIFLRGVSPERHRRLRGLFKNVVLHTLAAGACLSIYYFADSALQDQPWRRLVPNFGLAALIWWAIVLTKIFRIFVFEYLFFMNMRTGVPVLIVNLLTLLLSLVLAAWILAGVFNFHLAPLLATSAVFSIVLGLALQDTLGNLVAGVALQLDKPYGIGDWIEIATGSGPRTVGQVREITWRAVNLIGFLDETITIPNRLMSQAEVHNYSGRDRPFLRTQVYRIPYGQPLPKIRELMTRAIVGIPGVREAPPPIVFFSESTESWMAVKLIYSVYDYGGQFRVADAINSAVIEKLAEAGIPLASPHMEISRRA